MTEQIGELWTEHSKQSEKRPEELLIEQSEEQTAEQREELLTEQTEKLWTEHSEQLEEPDQLDEHSLPKQSEKQLVEESEHLSLSQAGEAKHIPWEIVCKGDVCSLVKLRKN